jgi:hypothetical protein
MNIEKLKDGLWVPSTDAQIDDWREKGYPHMQDKCLKQFVKWCNVAPYNHVRTYNQAIGNEDGHIALSEESATQNTRVLLQKGDTRISKLDSLDINDIDMLKIDVEGLEMEVLKGAAHCLEKIKFIMIELNNNSKRYGSSNLEIEKHLKDLGYKILIKTWPDIVYFKA